MASLVCKTNENRYFTKGELYKIVDEYPEHLVVIDDDNHPHNIMKESEFINNFDLDYSDEHEPVVCRCGGNDCFGCRPDKYL